MPVLSLSSSKDAVPIAIVRGGKNNGELLYLNENNVNVESKNFKSKVSKEKFFKALVPYKVSIKQKGYYYDLLSEVSNNLELEKLKLPDDLKKIYSDLLNEVHSGNSVNLPDNDEGKFQPIPSPDPTKRQIWYICGASGAGKSWFARGVAENYKKLYPDRDVFLVSKLNEDETLDNMKGGKPKRINVNSLVSNYPKDLEEFRESLIIFDDFDTFSKPFSEAVQKLIDDVASMGRHTVTSMLCISHLITGGNRTRLLLNETHFYVVYPNGCSAKGLNLLLGTYAGLDQKDIVSVRKSSSRWVCVFKNYPPYLINEKEARLLNTE
jgi:hypothetical protein